MSRRFSKRTIKKRGTATRRKRGGVSFSPASYPVGSSWQPNNVGSWAGVLKGVSDTGNHFAFKGGIVESHPESTPNIESYGGGRRRSRHSRKNKKTSRNKRSKHSRKNNSRHKILRGGSRNTLMPQSLVNLGRSVVFGAGELVNSWSGKQAPLSPSPTVQPIANNPRLVLSKLPNVPEIHRSAGQTVSDI